MIRLNLLMLFLPLCVGAAVENALKQIEDKKYDQYLIDSGISSDMIVKYGFAFEGKEVLIGRG